MSNKYIGARRKRTNTPALARQRAVEYRHRPFAPKKTYILQEPELLNEAIQETAEEIVVTQEQAEEPVKEEVIEAPSAQPAEAAAATGMIAMISNAFKGLFGRKKKNEEQPEGEHGTIVSDLKTWISSPIDPEDEPEETFSSDELSEEEILDEQIEAAEEITDTTASVNEAVETVEEETETVTEDSAVSEETDTEDTLISEPEDLINETETSDTSDSAEPLSEETVFSDDIPEETAAEEAETAVEENPEACEETAVTAEADEALETVTQESGEEDADTGITEEVQTEEAEPAEEEILNVPETESNEAEAESEPETEEVLSQSEEPAVDENPTEVIAEQADETEAAKEPEEEEEKLTRKEKRELKKEIRKETENMLIDEIIESPRAGILTMLVAPGMAMKRVASVEKTTLSAPAVLILNLLKWGAVGTFFAMFIEKFINIFHYSFIRMNFTGCANIAFRFGAFGLICEYVSWIVIGIVCGLIRRKISTFKLMEVESRSAPAVTLLFVIGCVLVWKDMLAYGVIAGICGTVIGFVTKGYGMDLVLSIGKNTQLVLVLLLTAAAAFVSFMYFPLAVSGLMEIFRTILNI